MSLSSLQVLANNRDALLLAEVAAWLHMLGKFHEDFLNGQYGLATQIPQDAVKNFPQLSKLLQDTWTGKIWAQIGVQEFQAENLSIASLIEQHQNPNAPTGFERLMQDAHGRGSVSEKGVLERFFSAQKGNVHLSTAFGYESAPFDLKWIQNTRQDFYRWLEEQLAHLKNKQAQVDWGRFRLVFLKKIRELYPNTVAETRRPVNDITLFDQTFASVAVFKAALAQNIWGGWKEPRQTNVADKYHWRILRVGMDGLQFWGTSSKLTDVLGRKAALEKALNRVQQILEEEYPMGTEMYRDENGSLFIVPDIPDLLDAQLKGSPLQTHLQEISRNELEEESLFTLTLSDKTRNMLSFGKLISAELPPFSSNPQAVLSMWQTQKETTDICPVCGIRPQGYDGVGKPFNQKALNRNVCGICERRRVDRSANWAKNLKTTIWTNEVADENGRLALIVGTFGLERWLTGEALSSVMSFEPSRRTLTDSKRNDAKYDFDYDKFLKEIEQALQFSGQPNNQVPLLNNLLLSYQRVGRTFSETYDFYVSDTDLSQPQREAHLFALSLMRQQPSPARLRRVWETTRCFWQTVLEEKDEQGNPILAPAGKRLELIPRNHRELDLGHFHSYELVVNNLRISVMWDSTNRRFIVCENLVYFARPERLGRSLKDYLQPGKEFTLEEPAGYGARNNVLGTITIERVSELPDEYLPAISILAEPRSFMMIVPADKSLDIVRFIGEKYEKEMGRVRDRLPLHLGCIYAHRRTPVRAVLDAGRAMLGHQTSSEQWRVKSVNRRAQTDADKLELELERNGCCIHWLMPLLMGDRTTEDRWYPYLFLDTGGDDSKADQPNRRAVKVSRPIGDKKQVDCWIVHAADLRPGETIYLWPSTFDFEFLDTTARRFEIYYDQNGRRPRRTRPFYLEDLSRLEQTWQTFSKLPKTQQTFSKFTKTQMKQILQTIETTRERWFGRDEGRISATDPTFRQFVADTLANARWNWKDIPEEQSKQLVESAVRGELTDLAELHMEILKE